MKNKLQTIDQSFEDLLGCLIGWDNEHAYNDQRIKRKQIGIIEGIYWDVFRYNQGMPDYESIIEDALEYNLEVMQNIACLDMQSNGSSEKYSHKDCIGLFVESENPTEEEIEDAYYRAWLEEYDNNGGEYYLREFVAFALNSLKFVYIVPAKYVMGFRCNTNKEEILLYCSDCQNMIFQEFSVGCSDKNNEFHSYKNLLNPFDEAIETCVALHIDSKSERSK